MRKYDELIIDPMSQDHIPAMVDHEALFSRSPDAKIINQGHLVANQLSGEFMTAVFDSTEDAIPYIPSCECLNLRGQFFINTYCPKCGTLVSTAFVNKLSHSAWLGIPDELPPVLHPVWYAILCDWTNNGIEKLLDPKAEMPMEYQANIGGQGYTYFHQNIAAIMEYWFTLYKDKKNTPWIRQLYEIYGRIMFTSKLPILHSSLHPMMTGSSTLRYADPNSKGILKAAYDLSAITFKISNTTTTVRGIDKSLFEIYKSVVEYYDSIIKDKLGTKYAIIRKHCLGTRCHFTGRAVIVPIAGAHNFDEIHLPWKLVVNTYKLEIINRLVNHYSYSVSAAIALHLGSLIEYNQLIYDILLELKNEHPLKVFPFLMGRNPTLQLFSIQLLYCTTIKTDLNDQTIGMSPCNVSGMNADFDGDELWLLCLKEHAALEDAKTIHPSEAVLDTNSSKVSTLIALTKQALITLQKFLHQNPDTGYEVVGPGAS